MKSMECGRATSTVWGGKCWFVIVG
jgi:hypothetical protein